MRKVYIFKTIISLYYRWIIFIENWMIWIIKWFLNTILPLKQSTINIKIWFLKSYLSKQY